MVGEREEENSHSSHFRLSPKSATTAASSQRDASTLLRRISASERRLVTRTSKSYRRSQFRKTVPEPVELINHSSQGTFALCSKPSRLTRKEQTKREEE